MIESNMKVLRELPSPQVLKQMYPLPEGLAEIKRKKDEFSSFFLYIVVFYYIIR